MTKVATILAIVAVASIAVFSVLHYRNARLSDVKLITDPDQVNPTAVYDAFVHYKEKHGLKWGKSESQLRLNVFTENYKIVVAHNAKKSSYQLGITSLAHLTREEFASLKLGYAGSNKTQSTEEVVEISNSNEDVIDWTEKGAVTPVKNQGACGSCWAFSTTGALEGLNYVRSGKLLSFSEQQLVDCSTSYGNNGCNGGLMDYGFQYVHDHGIITEDKYPYTGADGTCQKQGGDFKIGGFADVTQNNPDALAEAIGKGPVSVAIEADTSAFQLYKNGIITGDACGTQLDHGVLAVGYGKDYFKVKNSWGGDWGDQGFVKIGRASGAGVCGINSAASYPTL